MDMEELVMQAEESHESKNERAMEQFSDFWGQYRKPLCLAADAVYLGSAILSSLLFCLFSAMCIHYFCIPQAFGGVFPAPLQAFEDWFTNDAPRFFNRLCARSIFVYWICRFICSKVPVMFPRSRFLLKVQPLYYTFLCLLAPAAAIFWNNDATDSAYIESISGRMLYLGQMLLCILLMGGLLILLHRKSPKKKQCLWAGVLAAAVYAGCFLAYEFDLTGRVNYVPQADQVASVSFYGTDFSELDNISACTAVHKEILHAKAYSLPEKTDLVYTLKNGKVITRHYVPTDTNTVNAELQLKDSTALLNTAEGVLSRTLVPEEIVGTDHWCFSAVLRFKDVDSVPNKEGFYIISENELTDFYLTCILPDLKEGKVGEICLSETDEAFNARNSNVRLEYLLKDGETKWYKRTIIFRMDADRCLAWIRANSYNQYPINTLAKFYDDCSRLDANEK